MYIVVQRGRSVHGYGYKCFIYMYKTMNNVSIVQLAAMQIKYVVPMQQNFNSYFVKQTFVYLKFYAEDQNGQRQ